MKKILTLGLALFIGVSLSSCDDDDDNVQPMGITPAGSFDNPDNDADDQMDDQNNFFNEDDGSTGLGDIPDGRKSVDFELETDNSSSGNETTSWNSQNQ